MSNQSSWTLSISTSFWLALRCGSVDGSVDGSGEGVKDGAGSTTRLPRDNVLRPKAHLVHSLPAMQDGHW